MPAAEFFTFFGGKPVYSLDVEGDGNRPPSVVELALIPITGWGELGRNMHWLFRPPQPISEFASRLHGITDADVAEAPSFDDVADDLSDLLEDAVLLGHNVKVDLASLGRRMDRLRPSRVIDTLRLAKRIAPGLPSYSLHRLGDHFALTDKVAQETSGRPHTAIYDAILAARLLFQLLEDGSRADIETLLRGATLPDGEAQGSLL